MNGIDPADALLLFFICGTIACAMGREMMFMVRFVPKGKMSKKARKELNRQRRVTWEFSPATKTVESKKIYNRKKNSCDRQEDYGAGVFCCLQTTP